MKLRDLNVCDRKLTDKEWSDEYKNRAFNYKARLVNKAIENGINAIEIASEYIEAVNYYENDFSIFGILSKELCPTTKESFMRFGDLNHLKGTKAPYYWISRNGFHLDIQSIEISEIYHIQIDPQYCADFITSYPNGRKEYSKIIEEIESIFKENVGFNLTKEFAYEILGIDSKINQEWFEDVPF